MIADPWRVATHIATCSPSEIEFAATAWLVAPFVQVSLHVFGLQKTIAGIEAWADRATTKRGASATRPLRGSARVSVERGSWLVRAVYRRHFVRGACLPQSLVQYLLHRSAGQSVELVIGVKPPGAARLEAHAWVAESGVASQESAGFVPLSGATAQGCAS